jgi:hypothetical protein
MACDAFMADPVGRRFQFLDALDGYLASLPGSGMIQRVVSSVHDNDDQTLHAQSSNNVQVQSMQTKRSAVQGSIVRIDQIDRCV